MKRLINKIRRCFKKTEPEKNIPSPFFTKDILIANFIQVGDYTYGLPKVLQWGENTKLEIGKYCSIAEEVKIFLGGNHRVDWISTYPFNSVELFSNEGREITGHPASKGDVIIGNDVWIGTGAVILSGIKIGNGAVIAAYAIVTKDVQSYEIVGGNPAKHIKYRFEQKNIDLLNELEWWNLPEEKIRQLIPVLSSVNIDLLRLTLNK